MIAPQRLAPSHEGTRVAVQQHVDLSDLQAPKKEKVSKRTTELEKAQTQQPSEPNPSHFAPENPTNKELAKERWYTRAAWASLAICYSAGLLSIPFADGEVVTCHTTRGILMDVVFSYWALRNSELRRFILEGSVLPTPVHSDKFIRSLLGVGAACCFAAALSSVGMSLYQLSLSNYMLGAIVAGSAVGSLHVGCAWVRRIRFFSTINSQ